MMIEDKRSDVWHATILALREGGTTIDDICKKSGKNRYLVTRVLREMYDLGWVELPQTNDGEVCPGDAAKEYLRE